MMFQVRQPTRLSKLLAGLQRREGGGKEERREGGENEERME